MPKRTKTKLPGSLIERDFQDALDRLVRGAPRHNKLKRAKSEGRLRINVSSVALEAGRARTLIAYQGCQYPNVRSRVIAAMNADETVPPRSASEVITRLREEVLDLKQKLAAALDGQADHFLAREKAEREAEKWRNAHRRAERQLVEDAKVTQLRP